MPAHSKTPVMKHSPAPWVIQSGGVRDAKGHLVIMDEHNAAHICLCVNAHEELVSALRDALAFMEQVVAEHWIGDIKTENKAKAILSKLP